MFPNNAIIRARFISNMATVFSYRPVGIACPLDEPPGKGEINFVREFIFPQNGIIAHYSHRNHSELAHRFHQVNMASAGAFLATIFVQICRAANITMTSLAVLFMGQNDLLSTLLN